MHRQRVESGVLRSVGYDAVARVLELEFADGAVYRYLDVPASLHAGLMTADSHGTFFLDHVRDAGFAYRRVVRPHRR